MPESPLDQLKRGLHTGDVASLRGLLAGNRDLAAAIKEPLCSFDAPPIVHFAAREDPAMVELLLEFGADPNARSGWWAGPFHALHSASPSAARVLLAAGATPDACAAAHLDDVDMLDAMLTADPSRVHERGGDGQTPLHFARSRAVVDLLLAHGADIDARDVDHRSTAAEWMLDRRSDAGRYALAEYLVDRGATVDIFLGCALGLAERVRAMAAADPQLVSQRTNHGPYAEQPPSSYHIYTWTIGQNLTPLQVALQFGHPAVADVLRELSPPRQRLIDACELGDGQEASHIMQTHPGVVQELGERDHRALVAAAWAGNLPAIRLMLSLGFPIDVAGDDGATALHCAAWQGAADCVAALLRHEGGAALLSRRDGTHGGIPLGWCLHGSQHSGFAAARHPDVARLLLEAGSPVEWSPGDGSGAVDAVIREWLAPSSRRR